ncbi:hypothetical protein B0O99DRAFT_735679 [Bisporella sp. PMI_857]|nr:hypothetical protein B0O99DRAFT_735679 [Bisporella sp. PMI_857]
MAPHTGGPSSGSRPARKKREVNYEEAMEIFDRGNVLLDHGQMIEDRKYVQGDNMDNNHLAEEFEEQLPEPVRKKTKIAHNLASGETSDEEIPATTKPRKSMVKVAQNATGPRKAPKLRVLRNGKGSSSKSKGATSPVVPSDDEESQNRAHKVVLDNNSAPIIGQEEIYSNMMKVLMTIPDGCEWMEHLGSRALTIGTMCSGTESPVLALEMVQLFCGRNHNKIFDFHHLFSAEIVEWKARYIERNFHPPVILSDITEFIRDRDRFTTAYGSLVEIPHSIDLLIAGFSCVDFSPLNNNKRTLIEAGESGDTFFSIKAYANKYRPKIIILENVLGAPWTDLSKMKKGYSSITSHMGEIGYAACHVALDTKDYYIPQTRQRGYMVCIDKEHYYNHMHGEDLKKYPWKEWEVLPTVVWEKRAASEKDIQIKLNRWRELVTITFKRPANVPAECWLLPDDDISLESIRSTEASFDAAKKDINWDKCRKEHESYRLRERLGNGRPLSHWDSRGGFKFPDWFHTKTRSMGERIFDSIDTAHLRKLAFPGLDDRYFARLLQLSQNVFREKDAAGDGIIGCVTPSGIPWSTLRGRKINGLESLILQGLPIKKMDLNGLTQAQLQDFAGNAMTTTVVGICELAALIAFGPILSSPGQDIPIYAKETENFSCRKALSEEEFTERQTGLQFKVVDAMNYEKLSFKRAVAECAMSVRLCSVYCTDPKPGGSYNICRNCGHTTCKSHAGHPKHDYKIVKVGPRKPAHEFKALMEKSLPHKWVFGSSYATSAIDHLLEEYIQKCGKDYVDLATWDKIRDEVKMALNSPLYFQGAERVNSWWEVRYVSEPAILICIITTSSIQWLLQASGTSADGAKLSWNSEKSKILRDFPILQMRPTGDDITQGRWHFWVHKRRTVDAKVTSHGSLVPSYQSKVGLLDYRKDKVATQVQLRLVNEDAKEYFEYDIQGLYHLSQACGQAFDSLHVLDSKDPEIPPMFLFLDQENREGQAENFPFVISLNASRLLARAPRQNVVARLPKWRQPIFQGDDEVSYEQAIKIQLHGYWGCQSLDVTLSTEKSQLITYGQLPASFEMLKEDCSRSLSVFEASTSLPHVVNDIFLPHNKTITIDQFTAPHLESHFGWALHKALKNDNHGLLNEAWNETHVCDNTKYCKKCFPEEPACRWNSNPRVKTSNQQSKVYPQEDPKEARTYELALKTRPAAISAFLRIDNGIHFKFKIKVNPSTLIHRTRGLLPHTHDVRPVKSWWRLVTDNSQIKLNLPELDIPVIEQSSAERAQVGIRPEDSSHIKAVLESKEFRKLFVENFKFFEEQENALIFMISRENSSKVFVEHEYAEEKLSQLHQAIWAKVCRETLVRGSLAAFDVGFGKTILTIGLWAYQKVADHQWAHSTTKGVIRIKATMIFVPPQLTIQWKEEIQRFVKSPVILTLTKASDVKSTTVQSYLDADFIIVSTKLCDGVYKSAIRDFSGSLEIGTSPGDRAWEAWYEAACANIRDNVDMLFRNPGDVEGNIENQVKDNEELKRRYKTIIPSKRFRGQFYQDQKKKKALKKFQSFDTKPKISSANSEQSRFGLRDVKDYTEMLAPLLEMFAPARFVIDEFHYIDTSTVLYHLLVYISNNSRAKLLLSGTPPLGGFHQVKLAAQLMGIHLGADNFQEMPVEIYKKKYETLTSREKFLYPTERNSPGITELRYLCAQNFLNEFARKGELKHQVESKEHIRLVQLPVGQRLVYSEWQAELSAEWGTEDVKISSFIQNLLQQASCPRPESEQFEEINDKEPDDETVHPVDDGERHSDGEVEGISGEDAGQIADRETDVDDVEATNILRNSKQNKSKVKKRKVKKKSYPSKLKSAAQILQKRQTAYDKYVADLVEQLGMALFLERNWNPRPDQVKTLTEEQRYPATWMMEKSLRHNDRAINIIFQRAIVEAEKFNLAADVDVYFPQNKNGKGGGFPKGQATGAHKHMTKHQKLLIDYCTTVSGLKENIIDHLDNIRFTKAVYNISEHGENYQHQCDNCEGRKLPYDLTILIKCGHKFCNQCMKPVNLYKTCSIEGCNAFAEVFQSIPASQLHLQDSENTYGAKVDNIVRLIKGIPETEHVLLFTQEEVVNKQLQEAMGKAGIAFIALKGDADSAGPLHAFQTQGATQCAPKYKGKASKVLILNIGDESAAGSNLTIARHIIFVSPYYTTGSYSQRVYDAAMRQAIGRARRYGQAAEVQIYHFVTAKTVDVDIFEYRRRKVIMDRGTAFAPEQFQLLAMDLESDFASPTAPYYCPKDDD